ncbi:hypothetical protein BY996DRAFT_6414081 [Phakopsora pachyrhizi]|uniref:Expressed protein n=1 Tax=Phakopsora pachyrhizi TaxID=170000 RepID=A0AAV0BQZ7_PHAPC|nr:hypothetical protein BY996DRAFT_6414081 [Phakopsora pachyrhizi]CAH7689094.1 expressed protein [Phakopsora pachyrhizi]
MRRMFGNAFQSFDIASPSSSPPNKSINITTSSKETTPPQKPTLSPLSKANQPRRTSNRSRGGDTDSFDSDVFSLNRLPFGAARQSNQSPSTHLSNQESRSRLLRLNQDSYSETSAANTTISSSPQSSIGGGTRPLNLKSDMMAQLLCGQAVSEASSFQMLPYERVERLKKDQVKLENRLDTINGKIKLEMKIRDASVVIIDTTEEISRINYSNTKLDSLREDRDECQSKLFNTRIRLLQHLAATLSLGLRKLEQQNASSAGSTKDGRSYGSPVQNGSLLKYESRNERSPSPVLTRLSSRSTGTALDRFDGPHLFANNQDLQQLNGIKSQDAALYDKKIESLTEEVFSLQNLLNSKESLIAEQSADLSLLQLELETVKVSKTGPLNLSKSNNDQALQTQLQSERDNARRELEALKIENSRLKQEVGRLESGESTSKSQLEKLKSEADFLKADLERERSSVAKEDSERNVILIDRAREAEDRAREALTAQKETNLEIERLRKELELARSSSKSVTDDLMDARLSVTKLTTEKKSLESELTRAQSRELSGESQSAELREENLKQWELLATSLSRLEGKLIEDDKTLGPYLSSLSLNPQLSSSSARNSFVQKLSSSLESYLSLTKASIDDLKQDKSKLESVIAELETKLDEKDKQDKQSEPVDAEGLKSQLAEAKKSVEEAETKLKEYAIVDKTLRDLFKTIPTNMEARNKVDGDADLSTFKEAYEQPKTFGGLGGFFGLGKRAPTPVVEESEYSVEAVAERIKLVMDHDRKLIDRLVKYEAEKDSHKNNAIRAQKLVVESQEALKTYQLQVKELEERLESSDSTSAAMLEKFNDLIESEEKANAIARRAEASTLQLQNQIKTLTEELQSCKKANEKLQKSLDDLKEESKNTEDLKKKLKGRTDEIDDLMEELKMAKDRETKARNQFMNELSEAQNEASSLRTKVRQLERAERDRS